MTIALKIFLQKSTKKNTKRNLKLPALNNFYTLIDDAVCKSGSFQWRLYLGMQKL